MPDPFRPKSRARARSVFSLSKNEPVQTAPSKEEKAEIETPAPKKRVAKKTAAKKAATPVKRSKKSNSEDVGS